ncbi:hypothetical protein D6D29_10600 [Aureobasidium pullulans]|uniref:P-loop containing nucleoside triphosphate hydrolase protein n=1 Tax=Aureobasidium pullulans TaxID=5580 RepID=A0A4S8S507_AURPU|nr:hypothetical protein D6D29_10600 [Aureobasidium pullulans]THW55334.1 hypothetical protein D6D20_09555 [Aureobasidium pullulans]
MEPFKPYTFEELRLADYSKIRKTNTSSKEFFGLPTAPVTPQPQAATHVSVKPEESSASISIQPGEKEDVKAPAITGTFFSSDFWADAAASKSFFGLSTTPAVSHPEVRQSMKPPSTRTEAPSLFSTLPISPWNVKDTADSRSRPEVSATSNKSSPSWLPSAAPNKQDNPMAQETSLFSYLPKTAAVTSFSTSLSFASQPPVFGSTKSVSGERQKYMSLHHTKDNKTSGADEQLRTTPLLSLSVKEASEARKTGNSSMFPQYAFLGCRISDARTLEDDDKNEDHFLESEPVLLNTNTPWSAFICGSQGSGKSYSLSAIIENCLHASPKIGKLPKPLAGVVFHNNTASAHNICEAAHLVSLGTKVKVLVSRSNYHALSSIYKKAVSPQAAHLLNIQPLVLQSYHLPAERMHRLMAFQESETAVPLYMEVIMRILREMAITGLPFNYSTFKAHLANEGLMPGQKVMMDMRLCLLESFMDPSCTRPTKSSAKKTDLFSTVPGTLTIVDLSDPFLDSSTTCTLFDILLSLFLSSRPEAGMLICLDEAHKFMKNTPAAETFTENLLTVIREQRHNACRVVIATQEPTISPKLLDLCSITMVHRFTSPDWLTTLRGHLAGASDLVTSSDDSSKKISAAKLFKKIINLDVGESLLFAPSAVLDMDGGEVKKLGTGFVKFKTRVRLGEDGGQSVLAVRH